ncbi:MAG TPA: hypothetical protein VGM12_22935 [Trebonia sp.]|jgi:hypothetical protein
MTRDALGEAAFAAEFDHGRAAAFAIHEDDLDPCAREDLMDIYRRWRRDIELRDRVWLDRTGFSGREG